MKKEDDKSNDVEDLEEISLEEVMSKMFSGQDETARILNEFGIDIDLVETSGIFDETQTDMKKK